MFASLVFLSLIKFLNTLHKITQLKKIHIIDKIVLRKGNIWFVLRIFFNIPIPNLP